MTFPVLLRAAGFFLLVSGWAIVPASFRLLRAPGARAGFVLAGFAVELLALLWSFVRTGSHGGRNMMSEAQQVLCFALILLVPLAAAGIALMNTGLGRARSAAHTMLASLSMLATAALAYLVCGYALQNYSGGTAFPGLFLVAVKLNASPESLGILLSMLSAGIGAMIPLGAGSDRWRLSACCYSAAVFAGLIFPVFSHWVWNGGWLAEAGFLDTGGASTIHVSGGLAALSIAWLLGPRRGKYVDGVPAALPGHDAVLVILGCVLALVGWLGLNCAGAILYNRLAAGAWFLSR